MSESTVSRSELWRNRLQRLRDSVRRAVPFATGVSAALGAILIYSILVPGPHVPTPRELNDSVAQALGSATPPAPFSTYVYEVVRPSLVLIQTKGTDPEGNPGDSLGSGVVIDDAGDILTSLHVVANATQIKVTFADGTESSAQIVLSQPENDIAVLHPDQLPEQLYPAVLGNPNAMRVGDEAYVIGNPFGLYGSMSSGVISGFNRSFELPNSELTLHGLIQIDAAVNPGNSGGPLLNRYGQVIGIVEGIVNPSGIDAFVGIGFAVPINVAVSGMGSPPY